MGFKIFSVLSLGFLPAVLVINDLLTLKIKKEILALPPIDENSLFREQEIYRRICHFIDFFWGAGTHGNVIISLFEKGELKSLEEIHAFLVDEVVEMFVKEGFDKEEIVETLNLPFTKQKHPMSYFFHLKDIIAKYESGMNNQMILNDLAKGLDSETLKKKLKMRLLIKRGYWTEGDIKRGYTAPH